jgi:Leucine-rich repeat (LRR) protein
MKQFILDHIEHPPELVVGRSPPDRHDDAWFAALPNLAQIGRCELRGQRITRIPAMPRCTSLELSNMQLASLDGIEAMLHLTMVGLERLPNLDLARAFDQLAELPELTKLVLTGFNELPESIVKLHSLFDIWLCDSPQIDFIAAFELLGNVDCLRMMSLFQHIRCELGDAFAPLTQVRSLELAFDFTVLPPSIGEMTNLEELIAGRNKFTELPATFGKLAKLTVLDLSGSKIRSIPDELCNCTALEKLNLHRTGIKAVPDAIGELVNLRELIINSTFVKTLPASAAKLVNLRQLWLPDKIKELPAAVYELRLGDVMPRELEARFATREPDVPENDYYQNSNDPIPASLGQPRVVRLFQRELDCPVEQLAQVTRLRHLGVNVPKLGCVLPYVTKDLALLEITSEETTIDLTRFKNLRGLDIRAPLVELPALGTSLRRLSISNGPTPFSSDGPDLAPLATLELEHLHLHAAATTFQPPPTLVELSLTMPNLRALPAELAACTRLTSLSVSCPSLVDVEVLGKMPALAELLMSSPIDLTTLCTALAGKPFESLELGFSFDSLPPAIGLLRVKQLDIRYARELTTLPAELADCANLELIQLPRDLDRGVEIKPFLPKGRWKKHDSNGLRYTRSV